MQLLKIIVITPVILLATTMLLQSQVGFKYQAVIRDAEGNAMLETDTDVRLSITKSDGELVYQEVHIEETTTTFGIIGLEVGAGFIENGIAIDFTEIDWGADIYALSVELRMPEVENNDWVLYGTSPILTVPVAMYAHTVRDKDDADADPDNEIQNLSLE